jgi:hypothetical protein
MQSRWVQLAENALSSPASVRIINPGFVPNLNILPVFGAISAFFPTETEFC